MLIPSGSSPCATKRISMPAVLVPSPPCLSRHSSSQLEAFSQTFPHSAVPPKLYQLGTQSRLPTTYALSPAMFGNSDLDSYSSLRLSPSLECSAGFLLDTFTPSNPRELFFSILRTLSQVGTVTSRRSRAYMDERLGPSRIQACRSRSRPNFEPDLLS